jgi:hypothetical protein
MLPVFKQIDEKEKKSLLFFNTNILTEIGDSSVVAKGIFNCISYKYRLMSFPGPYLLCMKNSI